MKKIEIEKLKEEKYGVHIIDTHSPNTVSYYICTKYSISSNGYIELTTLDPSYPFMKIKFDEISIQRKIYKV